MRHLVPKIVFASLSAAWLTAGCNTDAQQQEKTNELIQARLDAEKVKDLSSANQELKATNEALQKDNQDLKLQVAKLQGAAAQAARVAANKSTRGNRQASEPLSPAEVEQVKSAVTGGNSFK
jgi:hypothetical protein